MSAAPLSFAFMVLRTGEILLSRDERARCEFACRTLTEYYDFSYYRERYRREAPGLLWSTTPHLLGGACERLSETKQLTGRH